MIIGPNIFAMLCSISGKGRRKSSGSASPQPKSVSSYPEDEGKGKAVLQHLPYVTLSGFFEIRMRLEDIDLIEQNSGYDRDNKNNNPENPLKLLR